MLAIKVNISDAKEALESQSESTLPVVRPKEVDLNSSSVNNENSGTHATGEIEEVEATYKISMQTLELCVDEVEGQLHASKAIVFEQRTETASAAEADVLPVE